MKPRRVIVTIELTSNRKIDSIKAGYQLPVSASYPHDNIHQVQVNVVKKEKHEAACEG